MGKHNRDSNDSTTPAANNPNVASPTNLNAPNDPGVTDANSDKVGDDIRAQQSPGEQQRQQILDATAARSGAQSSNDRLAYESERAKTPQAHGAHVAPQVQVKGGEVAIAHFHLLHVGVEVGTEENNVSATYAPGALKAIKFKAKDDTGRKKLAALFQGIAAELLK